MNKIKELIKSNSIVLMIMSSIYNIPFYILNFKKLIKNKIVLRGVFVKNTKLNINGEGNIIIIDKLTRLENVEINMYGDYGKLEIEEKCIIKNSNFWFEDFSSSIIIGKNTTFERVHIASLENNSKVTIGEDCMFSRGIEIRTGDSHAVIDLLTMKKVNKAKDIYIGNHVWVGANVTVLKGVSIPDGCVIGLGSIITKSINERNSIVVGVPAKIVRRSIKWCRENMVEKR